MNFMVCYIQYEQVLHHRPGKPKQHQGAREMASHHIPGQDSFFQED